MLRAVCAVLAFAIAARTLAARADAAPPKRRCAAILTVAVHGASDAKGELASAVRDAFAERMDVAPDARVAAALRAEIDPGCIAGQCARRIATAAGARWLVRATIEHEGSDYDLEIVLTDGKSGHALPALKDRCTLCGWAEVSVRLGAHARAAVTVLEANPEPETSTVKPASEPRPGPGLTVAKWLTGVVAVGLLATSGVLFGIDGRGTCILPQGTEGLRCPRHYDTALEAGIISGAGVLAGATSGVLFWLDHSRRRIAPTAAVGATGFFVGVSAAF